MIRKWIVRGIIVSIIFSTIFLVSIPIFAVAIIQSHSSTASEEMIEDALTGLPNILTVDMVIGAIESQEKYGVPASLTLAQIIQESSGSMPGGLSLLAYECNNLFGVKGEGSAGSKEYTTKEYTSSGESYYVKAKFRKYNSVKEAIDEHGELVSGGRYKPYVEKAKTSDDWARAILKAGYATDPNYADSLISLMQRYNLYQFDKMSKKDAEDYMNGDGKYNGKFIWPLTIKGVITSYFGNRDQPTAGASTNHQAIDVAAPSGTPALAADGGKVIYAGWYGTGGNAVIIQHKDGLETHYYHLRSGDGIMVKEGQRVSQGQQIGKVGTTGASTGHHLHFGVRINGNFVDPLKYVKQPNI